MASAHSCGSADLTVARNSENLSERNINSLTVVGRHREEISSDMNDSATSWSSDRVDDDFNAGRSEIQTCVGERSASSIELC